MTYTPPDFATFLAKTRNLEVQFSILLGRYKIKGEAHAKTKQPETKETNTISAPEQSGLDILLAKVHDVNTCKTNRTSARDVFVKLSTELGEVAKEKNPEKNKQASMFLLGALIHRYFRIINEYDTSNKFTYFSLFASTEKNCGLFVAIRKALGFTAEIDDNKAYRKEDLKLLDEVTIVTALESFKRNMLAEVKSGVERYKTYPHFEDENRKFLKYLQVIIDEHKQQCSDLLKEYQAISYLESLAKFMDEEQKKIIEDISKWAIILKSEHSDFSSLSKEQVVEHLKRNVTNPTVTDIANLITTDVISKNFDKFDHDSFIETMKALQQSLASYRLLGAYSTLLHSPLISPGLKGCIYEVLGIEENIRELTNRDMLKSINLFIQYLEYKPALKISTVFYGGQDKLHTQAVRIKQKLLQSDQQVDVETKTEEKSVLML